MSPVWTFLAGLTLLLLFAWYFFSDSERARRILGSVITVLLVAFCLQCIIPPFDTKNDKGEIIKDGKIHLGLDLQGGTSYLIQLTPAVDEKGETQTITSDMVNQAIEAIRKRVDKFGVSEPVITPQGDERILVQIPGIDAKNIDMAREQLQKVAKLEFKLVHAQSDQLISEIDAGTKVIPPGYYIAQMKTKRNGKDVEERLLLNRKVALDGTHVERANSFYGPEGYGVHLGFDSEGGAQFGELTKQVFEEHSQMAIVLDNVVISAPGVKTGPIYGGSAEISGGGMADAEARDLASALENPLKTPVKIIEERSASSTLGSDSIRSGVVSGIGGLVLVLVFVAIYYRFAGLVAIIGLVVNIILLFGAMSLFGFVLTLPGIAGVILTIGLAVDANVLIYERLREEMATGKSLGMAIDSAYDKAFTVIFDANATTLITSAILFWQATGPVKGFAVTLTVGVIASVFSAMVVTRVLFSWAIKFNLIKEITMMHIIPNGRNFDFLGKRRLWIGLSLSVAVISIGIFAARYPQNLGIDFRGGDMLMLSSEKNVAVQDVREKINELKLGDPIVQKETAAVGSTGPAAEFISIRCPDGTADKVEAYLKKTMPEAGFTQHAKAHVGKIVGGELARGSLLALGLGMLGILLYVTMRFEFSYAVGAIIALLHDVVITIGLFSFSHEISLIMIGAILTIAGYSINDTIVVFDRIREGLHAGRKGSIQEIMNASINETLSRTLLTSGTTFLSVAALYFFGGPVLHDFAWVMLIGIVIGTYSSIFIASPLVLWWSGHKVERLRSEIERKEAPAVIA